MKPNAPRYQPIPLMVFGLFSLFTLLTNCSAQGGNQLSPQGRPLTQPQQNEIVFRHLTIDDGLSDNSVYHLLQDRQGFIWATTVNGINRFDLNSETWTQFHGDPLNPNALAGVSASQQMRILIPWAIRKFGPKLYIMGPDYNFGTISGIWVNYNAKRYGGQVLGEEYLPLSMTDYSPTIERIKIIDSIKQL